MAKEKCDCGKLAVWTYHYDWFICDDCVSSIDDIGCTCNWRGFEFDEQPEGVEGKDWKRVIGKNADYEITREDNRWQKVDKRGRAYPCCEYEHDENGFDIPTWWSDIKWNALFKWFLFKEAFGRWWERNICADYPSNKNN